MALDWILASASPRRRELLARAGLHPTVIPAAIDETPRDDEGPVRYALRMARDKALAVSAQDARWVLAADTVVHLEGRVYGKPAHSDDARRMLRELSGCWHVVTSAFALAKSARVVQESSVSTRVRFRPLGPGDIDRYVSGGEPLDKAGGYGIQGDGGALVDQVLGSYTCVVGLPLAEVLAALRGHGIVEEETT
ncbi:MAG: Maf family protein [Pseudomonadota bacterium]